MTAPPAGAANAWADAVLAATLFAIDYEMAGVAVRAHAGPVRDLWFALVAGLLPAGAPVRRLPVNVTDDRLLGALNLAATLAAGRPVAERGVLAEAHGGVLVLPCAERLSPSIVARITATQDQGEAAVERDGLAVRAPARFGFIALDEGLADDERPPAALVDRAAYHVDLTDVRPRDTNAETQGRDAIDGARRRLPAVRAHDAAVEALTGAALALGIPSLRAALLAVRAARAAAALEGRSNVSEEDVMTAGRLVLAPRAARLPVSEPPAEFHEPDAAPPRDAGGQENESAHDDGPLEDRVLAAVEAAIPPSLLARLMRERSGEARSRSVGRAGATRQSPRRGRPIGACQGELRRGARLNIVETLRAAARWRGARRRGRSRPPYGQRLEVEGDSPPGRGSPRIEVRRDDFRITRFKTRAETTAIFVVDASGSTALHRLAEAKGAVELLLADCYARRDTVALIAFRGRGAELLLPPTRSLVRAKRSLAGLPGGGGTPLAAAIEAAASLGDAVRRKGQTPSIIFLTDGRANVARDPNAARARAGEDALAAARLLRATGLQALVIDTSPRPERQAARLAGEMGAVYLPLPHADAAALSEAVRAATVKG